MAKKIIIKVAKKPDGTSVNYEAFGDKGQMMEDAFEFAGKTPGGAMQYRGRPGTAFQDVHFVTDPTSKKSSLFMMKDGKLVPTEFNNLGVDELLKMRNQLIEGSVQRAQKLAGNAPVQTMLPQSVPIAMNRLP